MTEDLRHALAVFGVHSRHRRQVAHGDLRGDAAFAHLLLHSFRQCVHQRQAARYPGRTAIKAPRQIGDRVAQPLFHLGEQPTLLDRCFRLAVRTQRTHQQQRGAFAHIPYDRLDRVAPELLKRGDALVAIDHQITLLVRDYDHRRLLAGLSQ